MSILTWIIGFIILLVIIKVVTGWKNTKSEDNIGKRIFDACCHRG